MLHLYTSRGTICNPRKHKKHLQLYRASGDKNYKWNCWLSNKSLPVSYNNDTFQIAHCDGKQVHFLSCKSWLFTSQSVFWKSFVAYRLVWKIRSSDLFKCKLDNKVFVSFCPVNASSRPLIRNPFALLKNQLPRSTDVNVKPSVLPQSLLLHSSSFRVRDNVSKHFMGSSLAYTFSQDSVSSRSISRSGAAVRFSPLFVFVTGRWLICLVIPVCMAAC